MFQKEIKTAIDIQATPAEVWAVLTDFTAYPQWNPFIKSTKGDFSEGAQVEVAIDGMTFKPKVLAYKPGKELRWLGRFLLPGIFDGEHRFLIEEQGNGTVTLRHEEKFNGLLLPLMRNMLDTKTKAGFQAMNEALKARVEQA